MQNDLARAVLIVGILAFACCAAWLAHNPDYLALALLACFVRRPKAARKSVEARFLDIEHKLEQIAQLIQRRP